MALQGIAHQLAHRERQMTMRAPVLERDRRAVLEAIEHDRLAENDPAERLALDLGVGGGNVPVVPEEHGLSSSAPRRLICAHAKRKGHRFQSCRGAARACARRRTALRIRACP